MCVYDSITKTQAKKFKKKTHIIPPSIPAIAAWASRNCFSMAELLAGATLVMLAGVLATLLLSWFHIGTLSYGLVSWGLFVRSMPFLPRLALRRRSAAREKRLEMLLSLFSEMLRPRLCALTGGPLDPVMEEFLEWVWIGGTSFIVAVADLVLPSSSSITISITPEPCETPETIELVFGLVGRYKGAGGGGGGIAKCCNSFKIGGAGGGGGGGGVRLLFEGLRGWVLASMVSSIPFMIPGVAGEEYNGLLFLVS